jgi:hypothetical protein
MNTFSVSDFIKKLYSTTYLVHALAFVALMFALAIFAHSGVCAFDFFVVGFATFDRIGYTLATTNVADGTDVMTRTAMYRITQVFVQVTMLALIYLSCGLWPVAGAVLAWWFTGCDNLYYTLGKDTPLGNYPWLEGWSVFVVLKHFGLRATDRTFTILAYTGLTIGAALAML